MRINALSSLSERTSFCSGSVKHKNNKVTQPKSDNDRLKKDLALLALLGTSCVCYAVLKKKNINPINAVKNSLKNFGNKFSDKSETDIIIEKLNGKRDAEAVKIYNSCRAQKKLESFRNRVLNGEFDKKSKEVFQHLIENQKKLERTAGAIV